ncbi:MAG: hypothetical protein ACRC18_06355 [Cetobacterium sp.]
MTMIQIDTGKHTTKAMLGDKRVKFDSKIDLGKAQFDNSDTVVFEGKEYIVGEEAHTYDMSLSKNTDHHKLLIYTAIAKLIDDDARVDVVVGTPLRLFFNEDEKKDYIESISNDNMPIVISINGVKKYFSINKVIIAPESLGGSLLDFKDSKKIIRGCIDVGGLNINGVIFDKGMPVRKSMFTINEGTHILESKLKQEIIEKTGVALEDYVLKDYLVRGCSNSKVQKIIDEYCSRFIKNVVNECLKANWNLYDIEIYAMGGGSILLEKYIDANFKSPVFPRDVFANVKAFGIFGEKKLGSKK